MFCSILCEVIIRIATKQTVLPEIEDGLIKAFFSPNEKFNIPVFLDENKKRDTNEKLRQISRFRMNIKHFRVIAVYSGEKKPS